ncbi:MAG: Holliday junction branch migration protein RuvA [Dethiobacter sp.]|jgi:Holliday junction DNA helicase RuvA|nr:Holliday junction branch migration protein RuvA [Dethiobacter sp.]MBS3900699.1 Holliday junction branch migration protein RuvA [Dethiobacter sp.]MBS3990321.1 Holliday junction branch migration protein RuvA [Dethiobacter sp.]
MFNYLSGTLAQIGKDYVVLDNRGIGWQLFVPTTVLRRLQTVGKEIKLFTFLLVREDDLQLYGFLSAEDLLLFKMLLSVSGVGPKAALGVLSTLSALDFYMSVLNEDIRVLTRVPGIGPKSAKRLVVELKDKVTALGAPGSVAVTACPAGIAPQPFQDALQALLALGYSGTEAQSVLQSMVGWETMTTEQLLRSALSQLGSK